MTQIKKSKQAAKTPEAKVSPWSIAKLIATLSLTAYFQIQIHNQNSQIQQLTTQIGTLTSTISTMRNVEGSGARAIGTSINSTFTDSVIQTGGLIPDRKPKPANHDSDQ
jgi:hypothetical protein